MKKYEITFIKENTKTGKLKKISRKFSGDSLMEIVNKIHKMSTENIEIKIINIFELQNSKYNLN